ncbi:MAG: phosphoglucosamine mutase [Planctomycetia bacterium]|nr:phosphoglucosamine mutase [Planctomycetia bacterium]
MASPLIISVSGLRGEIGQTLTPEVAMHYVLAYASVLREEYEEGLFVVTRDGRRSGEMLADAIHSALNGIGFSTLDGDVAATPTTGLLIREYEAIGGIQISASHNPRQYNGIKLFSAEGRVIPKLLGEKVLQRYRELENNLNSQKGSSFVQWVDVEKLGERTFIEDTTSFHLRQVLATVDVPQIRNKKFKVLLDSNHGAGGILGRRLLDELGCEVVFLGDEPNGDFEHTPEPIVENLKSVFEKVQKAKVDIGFCQDPDADRLALIDADGNYIGEEYTVALCSKNRLEKLYEMNQPLGNIVINCASSRMSIDIANQFEVDCCRSAVGEANVVDLMIAQNAVFGGEGNGGPIDPKVGFVRDSFVGMANILDAMARRNLSVAQLAAEIPKYSIVKRKITLLLEKVPAVLDGISSHYSNQKQNNLDGLRIDWDNAWVLIRASNTEPIVRVIAEAQTESEANRIADEIETVIHKLVENP